MAPSPFPSSSCGDRLSAPPSSDGSGLFVRSVGAPSPSPTAFLMSGMMMAGIRLEIFSLGVGGYEGDAAIDGVKGIHHLYVTRGYG